MVLRRIGFLVRGERTGHEGSGDFGDRTSVSRKSRFILQPADFVDDGVEWMPRDVLHRVIVPTVGGAGAEDGDDVRMVQPSGVFRFAFETFEPFQVGEGIGRKELEGNVSAERFLYGFVDHAHAAETNPAEDSELSHPYRIGWLGRRFEGPGVVACNGFQLLHLDQRRE